MTTLILILVIISIISQFELYRRKVIKLHDASVIDKKTLKLLQANLAVAESARVNRKETALATAAVGAKLDNATKQTKLQIEEVPTLTAEKVMSQLKEHDSFHL